MAGNSIGNLLVNQGVVTVEQLKAALQRQRRFGGRLASCCLAQGYADEKTLARVLSRQQGVPYVVLSSCCINLELLQLLSLEAARKLMVLPLMRQDKELLLAMADPVDMARIDEVRFSTGLRIVEHGALAGMLEDTIEEAYRLLGGPARFWQGSDFDPSQPFADAGHVEIVVGGDEPDAPASTALQTNDDDPASWVKNLQQAPPSGPGPGQAPTVLVVDDEPEIRRLLTTFLHKAGFEVWQAADGSEAVKLLAQRHPAAVVLDAMLPGVHGFDICQRIKNSQATRHIVVVMVSAVYRGWRYSEDVKRLYGADAFLEKPLRLDELKHILQKALHAGGDSGPDEQQLEQQAAALLYQAAESFRRGELVQATQLLKQATTLSPFSAHLHHRLGLLYEKLGEPFRALASLERAVELEPNLQGLVSLARIYEKTGFRAKAYEAWERALRRCQDPAEAANIKATMEKLL